MLELMEGMTFGGQRLLRRLHGRDGREVFAAFDLADDRPTVVKLASLGRSDDVERLAREFAVLRAAAGAGVVPVLAHGVDVPQEVAWLTLATPAKVVDRMLTRVLAVAGLAAPIVSKILFLAGWSFDGLLRRSLPAGADLIARLGPLRFGACLAGILLAGAVVHFYVTRPLLAGEPEPALVPRAS